MTNNDISVRRLDPGTAGIAAALYVAGGHAGSGTGVSLPSMRAFLEDEKVWFLAAFLGGRPVGYLYGYLLPRPDAARPRFLLYDVDVGAAYRRRGVGSALIARIRAELEEHEARIWLVADASSSAAMGFYESLGGIRPNKADALFTLPRSRD